jgi:exopolysaccharide biosynthesis polyprenyl glycosylphosphotransferase
MSTSHRILTTARPRAITRHQEQRYLKLALLLLDALVVVSSFALAYVLRFETNLPFNEDAFRDTWFYMQVALALVPAQIILFYIYGLYNRTNLLGGTTEYARLFNATTAGVVLVLFFNFIKPEFTLARAWLLMSCMFIVCLGFMGRFLMRRVIYMQRRAGRFLDRTLIIGANPEGLAVAQQLLEARSSGAQIVGFVDDYLPVGSEPIAGMPVVGRSSSFAALVQSQEVDIIVIANTSITRERLLGIYGSLDALQDVEVRLASGLFELLTTGVRVREEGHVPLIVLNKTRITGMHYLLKTLVDYLLAGMALLFLAPVFLGIAIMIRRDSPGPVFYRRRVVGQGKRPFDAFKFRTMYVDGDVRLTPDQRMELAHEGKLKDDPRITRVGHLLRRYSIDELPQLVNVLLGQMSLIGPRMITAAELEKFGKWQHNLATVKPGLTGLWQISGRSDLSYEERVRLDMHYIRNHSIWLDLNILVQTIPALLTGRGAY